MECFLFKLFSKRLKFREKREEATKFSKEIFLSWKEFLKVRIHPGHKYKDMILPDSWDDEIIPHATRSSASRLNNYHRHRQATSLKRISGQIHIKNHF